MRISPQEIRENPNDLNDSMTDPNNEIFNSTKLDEDQIPLIGQQINNEQAEHAYEEGAKPKSIIGQFFSKILTSCANKFKQFQSTKLGKFLTSTILGQFITILFTSLTLASVFGPVGPLVISISVVTFVGVAVGVIAETIKTRSFRKLVKENNLLVQNSANLKMQETILEKLPSNLKEILKKDLYLPSPTSYNPHHISYSYEMLKNMWDTGVIHIASALNIGSKVAAAASGNITALMSAILSGTVAVGNIAYSGYTAHQLTNLTTKLKKNIKLELAIQSIEKYKNLQQLENKCKIQSIQTAALLALTHNPDNVQLPDEQIQNKFLIYKVAAAKLIEEKDYITLSEQDKMIKLHEEASKIKEGELLNFTSNNLEKKPNTNIVTAWIKSVGKDLWRTLNPLYEPPAVIQPAPLSNMAEVNKQDSQSQGLIKEIQAHDLELINHHSTQKQYVVESENLSPAPFKESTALNHEAAHKLPLQQKSKMSYTQKISDSDHLPSRRGMRRTRG